ncbi:MAG: type III-B CRISPR module-associated protein Cmr5 [Chloroflexota bacterium]
MSQQRTLQQKRAKQAFTDVNSVQDSVQKEYGSLVRGLPALIQSDGLATTLVFLQAKGKAHHKDAYKHIGTWVLTKMFENDAPKTANNDERKKIEKEIKDKVKATQFINWLVEVDSFMYRQATTETMAYLTWLKRFAEAKGIGDE